MTMKKILLSAIFAVFAISAFSQMNLTSFQYSMGFGAGSMHDYISSASFRGFTFDYRKAVNNNVGLGLDLGWNVFYKEMPYATYEGTNITYSGKQWRYSNHFPMLFAADYYAVNEGKVVPYGGLGIGTMYSLQNTDMATYTFEKDAWHFALRPELGILIKTAPGVGFNIVSKYYYGFKAGDLPAQGYFTVNVGFVFVN
jgi:hypothetical protein